MTIYDKTAIIVSIYDDNIGDVSGSVYMYTKIGGKWIENCKIVPDDGVYFDEFGYSVAMLGGSSIVCAHYAGNRNRVSAYIIYLCVP